VSLGAEHGYGLLLRIQQLSNGALEVEQGALYPALARLEGQGLVASEWGTSDNNRRAKYYALTRTGRARLEKEQSAWNAFAEAMALVLGAKKEGAR
jgi:transcriptional regulator